MVVQKHPPTSSTCSTIMVLDTFGTACPSSWNIMKSWNRLLTFRLGVQKQLDPQFLDLYSEPARPDFLPKKQPSLSFFLLRNDAARWTGVRETHLFCQKIGFIGWQWGFPILKFASGRQSSSPWVAKIICCDTHPFLGGDGDIPGFLKHHSRDLN